MALITQYSRISHHTIYGFTGSTFSVPVTEDFTSGSWTIYDLALSEIGVNETDEKAYIRIGSSIKEFEFAGATAAPISIYGDNGITVTGSTVSLGGTLSQATSLTGNFQLSLGTLSSRLKTFGVETDDSIFIRDDDGSNLSVLDMSAAGGSSILSSSVQSSGAGSEFSAGSYGKAYMKGTTGADYFQIELDAESATNKRMLVIDTITSRGLQYAADYSGQFVTHSLVSRKYVDDKVGNATQSLSEVLAADNYAATYSIRLGTGKITSDNATTTLSLNDTEFRYTAGTISYGDPNLTYGSYVYTLNREVVTSSDTQTTLWSFNTNDFGSSEAVFSIDAVLNGIDPTGSQAYFAKMFAGFKCVGGTISQVGITDITEIKDFTNATSNFLTDGVDIIFQVEGETATNIRWNARFTYHWTT